MSICNHIFSYVNTKLWQIKLIKANGQLTLLQRHQRFDDCFRQRQRWVLYAVSDAEEVLQVRLVQQQLPVRGQLWRLGQLGSDAVDKLGDVAGCVVVRLAEVESDHLRKNKGLS